MYSTSGRSGVRRSDVMDAVTESDEDDWEVRHEFPEEIIGQTAKLRKVARSFRNSDRD